MTYSQKYCIVSFARPQKTNAQFSMTDWPLHITLVDVFAIDRKNTQIESKLAQLLSDQPTIEVYAKKEDSLGNTKVTILSRPIELVSLHTKLVDLLEENNATFNSPEFTRAGFLPHSTIQKKAKLEVGDKPVIDSVALIDMFPDGDWQQRKVLALYDLSSVPSR